MSVWVVKQRPAGAVHPGHIAEARRAARGSPTRQQATEEQILDALWAARAAGVLVDVLADARAERRLDRLAFRGVEVVRRGFLGPSEPLVAIALHAAGSERAEVRFLRRSADDGAPAPEETPVVVRFAFADAHPHEDDAGVGIQRFRHGQPPRSEGRR